MIKFIENNASTAAIILTVMGGLYLGVRDIKADIKADIDKFEVRMERFETRMEKLDERWVTLLNEIHRLDKDVTVLKSKES